MLTISSYLHGFHPNIPRRLVGPGPLRPDRGIGYCGEQIGQPIEMMRWCFETTNTETWWPPPLVRHDAVCKMIDLGRANVRLRWRNLGGACLTAAERVHGATVTSAVQSRRVRPKEDRDAPAPSEQCR
jgi:hypothetical protein